MWAWWSFDSGSVGVLTYGGGVLVCGWVGRWSFDLGFWSFDFGSVGVLIYCGWVLVFAWGGCWSFDFGIGRVLML